MDGLFPRDAIVRQVDAEAVLLLGGGRALLMQLAHPSVAAGVVEHSDFRADPFGRLRRTLDATYSVVFGTEAEARRVGRSLARVHARVSGPGYSASDPELLLWVHATLVDTALRVHGRFLRRLSELESERYYEESKAIGEIFGVPASAQPKTFADFRDYVRTMVGTLEVTDDAREVARTVLHPGVPIVLEPALEVGRQLTAGLLAAPLRRQYGFSWDTPRQAALLAAGMASRQILPRLPAGLRRVPARAATRAAA
jgi:uncharacterized protein (DUF2236 family)